MRYILTIYYLVLTIGKKIFPIKNEWLTINSQWSIVNGQLFKGARGISFVSFQRGQALVTLLFFMIMGITITTAAVIIVLSDVTAATVVQQGVNAEYIAESGIDEGFLQLLRNSNFSGTETFSVGDGSVMVTVGSNTITATGSAANTVRTIQAQTVYNNNTLSISSRKEL